MELEESILIQRCIENNAKAQQLLYAKYSKKFYTICLRYSPNEEDAQDILQNSFIKIFTKLNTYNSLGSFEGWMRRIVTNTAIEYYRKNVYIESLDDSIEFNTTSNLDVQNLDAALILKLIQNLPEGYRIIFNMYAIEGYNHAEIAHKLNISEGTSKSQLSRARAILQKKIIELNKIKL